MVKQGRKMGDIVCLRCSYRDEGYNRTGYDQKVSSKSVDYSESLGLDLYGFGLLKSIYWPIKRLLHIRLVEGV